MLKGIGINIVVTVLLTVMIGGVLTVTLGTDGALGKSINTGFSKISNITATNSIVVEDNEVSGSAKKTFSDAAQYVYHRARDNGCAEDSPPRGLEDGYPGLEGTELTRYPSCEGSPQAEIVKITEDGNDAEGLPSRVSFTIKENFTLDLEDGETALEGGSSEIDPNIQLRGARKGSFKKLTRRGEDSGFLESNDFKVENKFILFYRFDSSRNRATHFFKQFGGWKEGEKDTYKPYDKPEYHRSWEPYKPKFRLCEGDEGYIQVNKGYPANTGEIGSDEPIFAHIVVEKKGVECGNLPKVSESEELMGKTLEIKGQDDEHANLPNVGVEDHPIELTDQSSFTVDESEVTVSESTCNLKVIDASPTPGNAKGVITFESGELIERDGSFPDSENGANVKEIYTAGYEAEEIWSNLKDEGFNGDQVTTDWAAAPPSFDLGTITYHQRYKLHGDLLCLGNDVSGLDQAEWAVCGRNLEEDFKVVNMGEEYRCDKGDWIEE